MWSAPLLFNGPLTPGGRKRAGFLIAVLAMGALTIAGFTFFKLAEGGFEVMRRLSTLGETFDAVESRMEERNTKLLKRMEQLESMIRRSGVETTYSDLGQDAKYLVDKRDRLQEVSGDVFRQQPTIPESPTEINVGPTVERRNGIGADGKYHWYPDLAGDKLGWHTFRKKAPENEARDPEMLMKAEKEYQEDIANRGPWPKNKQEGYDFYTRAFYHCRSEENIGHPGFSPEGGKWMCELHQLKDGSVVYSVGSSGDTGFEVAVHNICPACEIHTFDHTLDVATQRSLESINFIKFHPWGVTWPSNDDPDTRLKNLPDIMSLLHHDHLTILKIDCEGCEWGVFEHIFEGKETSYAPFDQIQVELHDLFEWGGFGREGRMVKKYESATERLNDFVRRLEEHGYRLFHWELNFQDFNCAELAFIHERVIKQQLPNKRKSSRRYALRY